MIRNIVLIAQETEGRDARTTLHPFRTSETNQSTNDRLYVSFKFEKTLLLKI